MAYEPGICVSSSFKSLDQSVDIGSDMTSACVSLGSLMTGDVISDIKRRSDAAAHGTVASYFVH